MEKTDEQIAGEVQAGNKEAFAFLLDRYESKMRRYGKRFLFGGDDLDDLIQDIFIKVYTNIQSFDTKQRFSPWIYRVAHNTFINAMKKSIRDRLVMFDFDTVFPTLSTDEKTDDLAHRKEAKEKMDKFLDRLGPKYKEPIVLFFYEELSYQEISDILRIPVSTVGVRINRAKRQLEKYYSQEYHE